MSHKILNACPPHFPSHSSSSFLAGFTGPIGQSDTWRYKNSSVERSCCVTPALPLRLLSSLWLSKRPVLLFKTIPFFLFMFMLRFHKKSHDTQKGTEADTPLTNVPSSTLKPDRREECSCIFYHNARFWLVRRCWWTVTAALTVVLILMQIAGLYLIHSFKLIHSDLDDGRSA